MEALALMLIHMLTPGGLSWTRNGVPQTSGAHDHLMAEKRAARPEDLCRGLPPVFEEFLRASRKLDFAARPDYEHWIEEFRDLADEYGFKDIDRFIWPSPCPQVRGVSRRCSPHARYALIDVTHTLKQPTVRVTAAPKPTKPAQRKEPGELERVLNGLANMQLGEPRQVLGERNELVNRGAAAPTDPAGGKGKAKAV